MKLLLALSLVFLCPPARAYPPEEKEMRSTLGKAVVKMLTGSQEAARAECEAGRAKLTEKSPKYLGAYIEACLALAAAPTGPGKKPASCAYYQRAVRIWKDNPPPKDNDDLRIERANKQNEWRNAAEKHCSDSPSKAEMKPVSIPRVPGGVVETQEGLSFELPDGWSVEKFDEVSGWAFLKGPDDYEMRVERTGSGADADYPERETLPDGRELRIEFKPFLAGAKNHVLFARVMLKDERIQIGMTRMKAAEGVEKERGLSWLRALASTAKVTGPRRCIGDCPPGKVRPKKKAAKK